MNNQEQVQSDDASRTSQQQQQQQEQNVTVNVPPTFQWNPVVVARFLEAFAQALRQIQL